MAKYTKKLNRRKHILSLLIMLAAIFVVNFIIQYYYFRIDLTSDKRYTLSDVSHKIMGNIEDIVFVRVYLGGEMPVGMKKFQNRVREKLDELKNYSHGNLQYEFRNPAEGTDAERDAIYAELSKKGMQSFLMQEADAAGGASQRLVFPGAIVSYQGKETVINLVQDNQMFTVEANLNFAEQNLEYNLVSVFDQITRKYKPPIAFVEGHGELDDRQIGDIYRELVDYYDVQRVELDGNINALDDFKAVIIAKPTEKWSEADKLVIDQYIMNGGSTAWFIDAVLVYEDSLQHHPYTFASICEHNLNDQLFRYGVRVNPNVIQDLQCAMRRIDMAPANQQPNFQLAYWTYFPLLIPPTDNSLTKGLNLIRSQYPGVIDTVNPNGNIQKSYLLYSSEYSKATSAPLMVDIESAISTNRNEFNQSYLPVAALLEGKFESAFRNRMVSQYNHGQAFDFKQQGDKRAKMIVVSDGDIIRNDVTIRGDRVSIWPLGLDREMNQTFGNKEFVKNIISYLADENDLLQMRSHDYKLRLLDKAKVAENRTSIILLNTVLPVILVLLAGIVFIWWRRRKYTK